MWITSMILLKKMIMMGTCQNDEEDSDGDGDDDDDCH